MSNHFKISSHFNYLCEQLDLLISELKYVGYQKAIYYKLPDIKKEFELEAPDSFLVERLHGDIAFNLILNAFNDLYLDEKPSGKIVKRHPGILTINDPDKIIYNRLTVVNKAKSDFKQLILSIDNNDARFEAVHSAIPNLLTLSAYRKIHFESDDPFSIRFTWMTKHATKTLSKSMALEMLNRSSNYSNPRAIDQSSWLSIVEREKLRVSSLNENEKLRIKRPTRVSPEVNVRFTAENRYHVSAALPFILLNPNKQTKYGELSHYQKNDYHPRKKEYNYLVDRIYLEKIE